MIRPPRSLPADVVISSRSTARPGARPPVDHVSYAASTTPASASAPALTPATYFSVQLLLVSVQSCDFRIGETSIDHIFRCDEALWAAWVSSFSSLANNVSSSVAEQVYTELGCRQLTFLLRQKYTQLV